MVSGTTNCYPDEVGNFNSIKVLRGVTARLFTVYGPGETPERLLPSLIQAAKAGRPQRLTSGHQKRDFTYVEDAAEGLLRLGQSSAEPGAVINLATGRLTPVRGLVRIAADVLNIPAENLEFGALSDRPEEMSHSPSRSSACTMQQAGGQLSRSNRAFGGPLSSCTAPTPPILSVEQQFGLTEHESELSLPLREQKTNPECRSTLVSSETTLN